MDPIEESVRRALEGGNPADGGFRRSIYAASMRAMERLIASRGASAEAAEAERTRVESILGRVEAEYAAYYGGDGVSVDPDIAHDDSRVHEPVAEGRHAGSHRAAGTAERTAMQDGRAPASFAPAAASAPATEREGELWQPGASSRGTATRRRPGRVVVLALLFVVAVAVLLALAAFLLTPSGTTGPDAAATGASTSAAASGVPAPGGPSWINVFSGASLEQVSTPAGGRVTSVEEAGRSAIRVSGPDGAEGEILINLGPGLVGTIAGSQVRVEVVAGSPDGALREFSVRCLFADTSVCERQRFATSMREEAFVFDVPIPASAGNPANLAIGPGLSAEGPDVDVYSVRMRVL